MVNLGGMQGLIAAYAASPQGQEAIRNYLLSPDGKKTIDAYLATPGGTDMACLLLTRALEGTNLPADVKARVLAAVREKNSC